MTLQSMMVRNTLAFLGAALLLAACGGGGGSAGTPVLGSGSGTGGSTTAGGTTTVAAAPVITLGLSSTTVTSASPATVTATVVDTAGNPLPNQVVSFATAASSGVLTPSSALTDSSGVATVRLAPAATTTVGADTVTASVTVNALSSTASAGFQLSATNVTVSSFSSDSGTTALSAYGQTTLTVQVSGAATGSSVGLTLTSACVAAGKATLSPTSTTTTTGTATFLFKDTGGCGSVLAADSLQVAVTGSAAGSTLSLPLTSPAASSITFVSASPEQIYLAGSGYVSTSLVTFKVVDISGNPLPGKSVGLSATTYTGGLTLDGTSATLNKTSDANGLVTALVNSGTVPTPVRIKAALSSPAVTTSSSNLSIAVGLPTQTAFSLAQATRNIEGFNIDGTANTYTVIASDRMGNPVPAGTSINFVAEGGQIVGIGQITATAAGLSQATAAFQSASPRPANGRITIVAYALGEESFLDLNGNNVYDPGEDFQDLGDVFVSRAFSSTFDPTVDQLIPQTLSTTGACVNASSPLLTLDASIPSAAVVNGANRCTGTWGQAYVRRATETVLSTSSARPLWLSVPGTLEITGCTASGLVNSSLRAVTNERFGASAVYNVAATGSLSVIASDANAVRLNPMAAGTTVTASSSTNITASVIGGSPVPSTTEATAVGISYSFTTTPATGYIALNFTSPSGLVTTYTVNLSQGNVPFSGATACGR